MPVRWTTSDGIALRRARLAKGWSQADVALRVDRTPSRISELERVVKGPPSEDLLGRLRTALPGAIQHLPMIERSRTLGTTPTERSFARIPDTVPSPSVSAWRNAWRPDRVRVLLVAESHVAAAENDEKVSVDASEYTDRKLPDDYVRLVYCLGYGEDTLCTPQPPENPGTRQFWDLLGQVARGLGEVQPRKAASTASRRIRWKIKTLEILEQRGIWLVDASVTPLYHPGGRRPLQGKQYRKAVQDSWQRFVWPEVRADLPAQIWIIGYGVYDALDGLPELRNAKVIDQPQSRLIERYSSTLRTLVNDCQPVVGDDAN